jgi:hypothetical protein
MKPRSAYLLAVAVVLMLVSMLTVVPGQANLILNGSFETPVVPIGSSWIRFGVGEEPLGFEWTVVTNNIDIVINGADGYPGIQSYAGSQFLGLVGSGSTGAIQQTFATTPGQEYTLFFAYASNPYIAEAAADVIVSDGVSTLLSQSIFHNTATINGLDWKTFSMNFTATGTSATLLFDNTIGSNSGGITLDDVDITAVPLPGAVWLLCSSLLGLAAFRRIKKS